MKKIITLGIAEDHPLVRQGLVSALKPHKNVTVLFQVSNGKELMEMLKTTRPNILLLDIEMPVMKAQDVLIKIGAKYPKIQVIIISAFFQKDYIVECFKLGVKAFLPKAGELETVLEAIYSVFENGMYADIKITKIIAQELRNQNAGRTLKTHGLTDSELEVLDLISKGHTRKKVAEMLEVKPETVNFHMSNVMRKTEIHNTPELISYAIQNKLITLQKL